MDSTGSFLQSIRCQLHWQKGHLQLPNISSRISVQLAKMVKLPCIFHWSIKNWIKLWEPGKCKQGKAQSQPLLFVSVSRRADINPQIGDKADKLKGDTKRKDTFRKDMLSYFFSYHSSLPKQLLLNEINILLLKLCHFPGRLFEHISLPGLTSGSVLIDFHYVIKLM